MKPIVSILMPTYNHEKYISQAIESALSQKTQYDWELLINNDCSTDNTRKIAQEYADKYPDKIKLIYPETNQGLIKSYKRLLDIAQGKYIAILESDDVWISEDKLEEQISFLESNDDYSLVASDFIRINDEGKEFNSVAHTFDTELNGDWYNQEICQNMLGAVTVLFRKSTYDKYCNIEDYLNLDFKTFDYPTWLTIAVFSKCKYIHQKLAAYRVIPTSISNSGNFKKNIDFENNVSKIQDYIINKFPEKEFDRFNFFESRYLRYISICLKFNKIIPYIKYAKKLKSNQFKFKFMHYFPIIWWIQHKIRIK